MRATSTRTRSTALAQAIRASSSTARLQTMLTYLALNQRNPYLRRPPVIEALKYLVDYDGIATGLLGGTRIVHQAFLPDGILGARRRAALPLRARARQGAARAPPIGATASRSASTWPPARRGSTSPRRLQASFARAGIRLTILPGDDKETLTKYRARRHEHLSRQLGHRIIPIPQSNAQAFLVDDDESERRRGQDARLAQFVAGPGSGASRRGGGAGERHRAPRRALPRAPTRRPARSALRHDVPGSGGRGAPSRHRRIGPRPEPRSHALCRDREALKSAAG